MAARRYELSDTQWEQIKEWIPKAKTGRPPKDDRMRFNAMFWLRDGFERFVENNVISDNFLYFNKEKATALSAESNTSWFEQLKDYDFNAIIRKTKCQGKHYPRNCPAIKRNENRIRTKGSKPITAASSFCVIPALSRSFRKLMFFTPFKNMRENH